MEASVQTLKLNLIMYSGTSALVRFFLFLFLTVKRIVVPNRDQRLTVQNLTYYNNTKSNKF